MQKALWHDYVVIPSYVRPTDVDELRGDSSKATAMLGWRPRTSFAELSCIMVEADLADVGLDPGQHLKVAGDIGA
jgi:GDPmannose 4,6-dehydratase